MRAALLLLALACVAGPAAAETLVTSQGPQAVAVTLYRDPARGEGPMDAKWPGGYALVTETRTVHLPAGRFVLRFEGVAEGMMPETAIVSGLPKSIDEKNRDARLLSPASLVNAWLKRRVTIRRTNPATDKVTTGEAVIEAGPGQGVVLTTKDGVEALGCSGLPEAMSYPGVPADLSAKPTLSVIADSAQAADVTIQLSYLSQGFDWSAHYVANVAEDGQTVDLFAWLTVANGGSQGFADAHTQAVAGAPNKESRPPRPVQSPPELHLKCWPMDITSTHPRWGLRVPAPPAPMAMRSVDEIVVTGSRAARNSGWTSNSPVAVVMAEQENLGDLKLYRVPEPVTVAAMGQKQVAMIDRKKVRFERIYTADFDRTTFRPDDDEPESSEATLTLRSENRDAKGLGLPLPAGGVAVFQDSEQGPLLIGEAELADRAVGDEVELKVGDSVDVQYRIIPRRPSESREPYRVEVSNARDTPVEFEIAIPFEVASHSARLIERKGQKAWRVTVPANGTARLDLALRLTERD
jgi:hypothetical protein